MRELKFRCWDGARMTTSFIMFKASSGCLETPTNYSFKEGDSTIPEDERMKIMQYTGLYDLYEDDIIELENWNPKRYVIKFIEGAFCIADIKTGKYVADIHYIHHAGKVQYKTIGNIYQNPELLK